MRLIAIRTRPIASKPRRGLTSAQISGQSSRNRSDAAFFSSRASTHSTDWMRAPFPARQAILESQTLFYCVVRLYRATRLSTLYRRPANSPAASSRYSACCRRATAIAWKPGSPLLFGVVGDQVLAADFLADALDGVLEALLFDKMKIRRRRFPWRRLRKGSRRRCRFVSL